jgi:hypothetical protein
MKHQTCSIHRKEEKAAETEEDETDKKNGYKIGDKIADGISLSIGRIEVNIQTLGLFKTDVFGPWYAHVKLDPIEVETTPSPSLFACPISPTSSSDAHFPVFVNVFVEHTGPQNNSGS